MSIADMILAMDYAKKVYMRRDVVFALSMLFGDSKGNDIPDAVIREGQKGNIDFHIEHPEIKAWIKEQNRLEKERKENGEM